MPTFHSNVFIGILFDSENLTLTVTPERLMEIKILVNEWLKFEKATLKQLQSLIGKLNFVAHCVKPARIFISRLLNWLREIQCTESAQSISSETKKDLEWWFHFLPKFNGISTMNLEEWSIPDEILASDSCLVGCGAFLNGRFFHTQFPEFVKKQTLHINALELLTVVVTLKVWGQLIKGKKMIIYCDDSASYKVLNTGFSRDHFLQSCLREICFHAAINEFQIRAREISSGDNRIPDYV